MIVRRAEPGDYEALHRIFSGPLVISGTLQLPFPSAEMWRQRLSESPEGTFSLVACIDEEVVGEISLLTTPTRWRMRRQHRYGSTRRLAG